jgi:RNA polymerase sigma-70 factor (ECF subfamily)
MDLEMLSEMQTERENRSASTIDINEPSRGLLPKCKSTTESGSSAGTAGQEGAPNPARFGQVPANRLVRRRPGEKDWETIQELFLSSRPRFVGLAYSVLRNKEDAEDAVQDALVSASRHLRGFEGRSALTTWFTRIVLNAALMIRRKRRPGRIESLPEPGAKDEISWTERIPDSHPDPEMAFAEKETFQWVDVILTKMSPLLRQAFTMTFYDEMSNKEAGALLDVTAGTFKSRVYRATQDVVTQAQRVFEVPFRNLGRIPFSSRRVDSTFVGKMTMASDDVSLLLSLAQ